VVQHRFLLTEGRVNPKSDHVGFMGDEVRYMILRMLQFSFPLRIPTKAHSVISDPGLVQWAHLRPKFKELSLISPPE
jgi:hypothetical protein